MVSQWARGVAMARVTVLVLIGVALTVTLTDNSGLVPDSYLELVSYYTFQINIVYVPLLVVLLWHQWRRTPPAPWVEYVRAFVAGNLVIVGLLYWSVVFPLGTQHGWGMTWVMVVSHIVTPLYVAWEFLVVGDKRTMPWRAWWVIALYPVLWTVATVVRSAYDTFRPYEHLDPHYGWGMVTFSMAWHMAVLSVMTAVVLRLRRWRRIPDPAWAASGAAHVSGAGLVAPRDVDGTLGQSGLPVLLLAGKQQTHDSPES